MNAPIWALTLAYWLHMLATILWIGGLAALALLVLPAARKALARGDYANLLSALQKRLDPVAWFSMLVLLVTGMFQMSAHPHYEGFLSIGSLWAGAILIKHVLFGLMLVVSGLITWGLLPALRRMALLQSRGAADEVEMAKLQRREALLMWANLILGVLILLLTAAARSA